MQLSKKGSYQLSNVFTFLGRSSIGGEQVATIKTKRTIQFVDWSPTGFKCGPLPVSFIGIVCRCRRDRKIPVAVDIRDPQQTAALNVIELFTARPTLRAKADYTKMRIHTATGENRIRSTAESTSATAENWQV